VTVRIQRKRTKGWRMPEGAVYVGRPTRWGNPWKVGDIAASGPVDAEQAVRLYAWWLDVSTTDGFGRAEPEAVAYFLDRLRDATALACWCPLDQPCHADVLIELLSRG
jgi:hypothetical protein